MVVLACEDCKERNYTTTKNKKNIKERLDYIYENKYRFQIWSKEGEGTIVTIRIPAIVSSETEK